MIEVNDTMNNKKLNHKEYDMLEQTIKEAILIERGELEPARIFKMKPLNIPKIRKEISKTQEEFADMLNISVKTLRKWEQGRRKPDGAALTLLRIVKADPTYVEKILSM